MVRLKVGNYYKTKGKLTVHIFGYDNSSPVFPYKGRFEGEVDSYSTWSPNGQYGPNTFEDFNLVRKTRPIQASDDYKYIINDEGGGL